MDEPIANDGHGKPVYLRDLWPTQKEVADTIAACVGPEQFTKEYGNVADGNAQWNAIPVKGGELFAFDQASTYIQEPPFFADLSTDGPRRHRPDHGRPRAGHGRRQRDDRPHQPRRRHQEGRPRRQVPPGARRARPRLQQLRQPPRERPRDDPRDVRQHPPQEPARPRDRGRRHHLPADRRGPRASTTRA